MKQKKKTLESTYKYLFNKIDKTINNNLKSAFGTYDTESYLKHFNNIQTYCLNHQDVIFDCIIIIYPYINSEPEKMIYALETKLHHAPLRNVISIWSKYLTSLLKNHYICKVFNHIMKQTLINLYKYHQIYEEKDKSKTLPELIKKEYFHINKNY